MSSTLRVEAISGLISIYLHFRKLYRRFLLWQLSLLSNHIINSILSSNMSQKWKYHNISISHLMAKQRLHLKFLLINVDDKWNEFFPSFSFFNEEFKPGSWLIDLFPDHFSFHSHLSCIKKHIKKLNKMKLCLELHLILPWQLLCLMLASKTTLPHQSPTCCGNH